MKKVLALLSVFALITAMASSCEEKQSSSESTDPHTAMNALDWEGSYYGTLPCADCEGIDTELRLNEDNTYRLTTSYLGKEDTQKETIEGAFEWLEDGNTIKLLGIEEGTRSPFVKIEENRVRYLDLEGNVIEGELENYYLLTKGGNPLVEDMKWQLVEFDGKEVRESDPDHYYIMFDSKVGLAHAEVGCNVLNFAYRLKNDVEVQFTQDMMTMMACPDDSIEDEFLAALKGVDRLSIDGDTLLLMKGETTPVARYILVKEKSNEDL